LLLITNCLLSSWFLVLQTSVSFDPNWILSCNCKQYSLVVNKLYWHNRHWCTYAYLRPVLCLVCLELTRIRCVEICVAGWLSSGLCACAVMLPHLRYRKEWIKVRDVLFFNQKFFLLVNVYIEIFPAIESCSFSAWLYQCHGILDGSIFVSVVQHV